MIIQYLSNIINGHKAHGKFNVHSGNKAVDYKAPGKWKTQLSMTINFIFFMSSNEIRTMHTKSDNIGILMDSETDDVCKDLKRDSKNQ